MPEATTGGKDQTEALQMARDALATALGGYVIEKRAIPAPAEPIDGHAPVIRVEIAAT